MTSHVVDFQVEVSPKVPFSGSLKNGFGPGKSIMFAGYAPRSGYSFRIDFQNSQTNEIVFHCNPRYYKGIIVRNTRDKWGYWGSEEWEWSENMPFGSGQEFQMEIKNEGSAFGVYFRGEKFCSFAHRLPYAGIDSFILAGDLNLQCVHY